MLAYVDPTHLYLAWKGSDGDKRIWYSSFDGSSWAEQQSLPDPIRTNARPGLGALVPTSGSGTQLWAAWKSEGSDDSIYYSTFNGSWSQQTQLVLPDSPAVKTTDGPAISSFDGLLYIMWKGSPDNGIYWTSFDPSTGNWIPQQQLFPSVVKTTAGPGLATFTTRRSALCAAWKGSPDQGLYYSFLTSPNASWTPQNKMPSPIGSSDGPSVAGFNGSLYAAWRGTGDEGLYYTGYNIQTGTLGYIGGLPNGTPPVQEQLPNPLASNYRPSIAAFSPSRRVTTLYFAWKGSDSDHSLYWTSAT